MISKAAAFSAQAKSPGCGVPVIKVGSKVFCGFSADGILRALKPDKAKSPLKNQG